MANELTVEISFDNGATFASVGTASPPSARVPPAGLNINVNDPLAYPAANYRSTAGPGVPFILRVHAT